VSRDLIRTVLILCALLAARTTLAEPRKLADGTTADRWTLPNGLEIVTRDVPGSRAISIAWGYHFGLDHDPADEPGLASLLAEIAFTAPAGDTPGRARDEMESLRPQGWSLRVTRRQTLFNETATTSQFPGVLHQVAGRMRGVTVSDAEVGAALATVRRTLGERYFGAPDQMLHWQVREYARGLDKGGILALASAKGLDRETPASLQQALARAYAPANGVLVLAGDLAGLDLRSIVAGEFGALPAGERSTPPPAAPLDSVTVVLERAEVPAPVGVLGLVAPALTDSLHPSFFLSLLLLGGQVKEVWGAPGRPLTTRFQYSLLDDPGFARFYPRLSAQQAADPRSLSALLGGVVEDLLGAIVQRETYDGLRYNMLWMMGGPMPRPLAESVQRDPAALNVLCCSLASQALWGNDTFWTEYRRRFDFGVSPAFSSWADYLKDPRHHARLLLAPRR
jgi:predicted Zn-dependent peptidase